MFVTHDVEEAIYLGPARGADGAAPGAHRQHLPRAAAARSATQDMKLSPEFLRLKREIVERIRETSGMKTDLELLRRKLCTATDRGRDATNLTMPGEADDETARVHPPGPVLWEET